MNVVIIGAGGHGKVVLEIVRRDLDVKFVGLVDDDKKSHGKAVDGITVLGDVDSLPALLRSKNLEGAIIAVGNNKARARLYDKIKKLGLSVINAIHPAALIARDVEIGEGVVIAAGATINTGTRIGNNVIINTGAVIDYGNVLEDHTHISPGVKLGSKVTVKKYTHIGLGAKVAEEVTIGENVTVGAGAVVLGNVPRNTTVVGVPAKIIKSKEGQ